MMNLQQNARGQRKRTASLCHKPGQLWHHKGDENCNQDGARERKESRINQCLLYTVAQFLRLHQVLHQAQKDLRQCTARACSNLFSKIERPSPRVMPSCSKCASCSVKISICPGGFFRFCEGVVT